MKPWGALDDAHTRTLLAVLAGHRTYPALLEHLGCSRSSLHRRLTLLRCLGLVAWEEGRRGTLRPTCTTNQCSATLRCDIESGPGAVGAAPGRGRHLQGGADMAGHYPGDAAPDQGAA